jgi:GMP synthase (glutamine-hydrolysing)
MTMKKKLCIIKTGETLPEIAARCGDFEDWIRKGMGLSAEEVDVVEVFRGADPPDPEGIAGVVITGSSALVSEREDWSERTASWLHVLVRAEKPVLGICYGHQLLAHAFGGRVARNPRGREIGSVSVSLRGAWRDDPLLCVLSEELKVQVTHVESVLELPQRARLYGASSGDPHQVFALGPQAWGVQFHPEFDAGIIRGYIDGRRAALVEESLDPDRLIAEARDSQDGTALLRRFAQIVREASVGGEDPSGQ